MGTIRVKGLGKFYKRYASDTGRIAEWISGGRLRRHERRWVLRGINFVIEPGEAFAVVGRNGAGKTTLLRLINGTLRPNTGSIEAEGRTAALELGLRFYDDLSGRQNVFMAGQLFGLSLAGINEKLSEIEAFSELSSRLEDPVRTYSNGMRLRLAFSIATAVRPDILLVDEALAVGDVRFQQKCLARIREFLAEGTCMLFVSHDLNSIRSFCDHAILLEQGELLRRGSPRTVLDYYNALLARQDKEYEICQQRPADHERAETRSGEGQAFVEEVVLLTEKRPSRTIAVGSDAVLRISGRANDGVDDLTVGFSIRDRLGREVYGTNTHHLLAERKALSAGERFVAEFKLQMNLGPEEYSITVALHAGRVHLEGSYDWWDHALIFNVLPGEKPHFEGLAYLPSQVRIFSPSSEAAVTASPEIEPLKVGAGGAE